MINLIQTTLKIGVALFLMGLFVSGCASGPTVSQASNFESAPKNGMSRLVIYRPKGLAGFAIQPTIKVNGKETGKCKPNGVFFIDVPSGNHQITAATEWQSKITVETKNSDVIYVRCGLRIGLFVGQPTLTVVADSKAMVEVSVLSFTGQF